MENNTEPSFSPILPEEQSSRKPLPGVGNFFARIFASYRKRFWTFAGIATMFWLGMFGATFFSFHFILEEDKLLIGFFAQIISFFVILWSFSALLHGAFSRDDTTKGFARLFVLGLRDTGSLFWLFLLAYLAILAPLFLIIAVSVTLMGIFEVDILENIYAFSWSIQALGLFIWPWVGVSMMAMVGERKRGIGALARGVNLLQGAYWVACGRFFLFSIAFFAVGYALGKLVFFIGFTVGASIPLAWISMALNVLVTPISALFIAHLFEDLKNARATEEQDTPLFLRARKFIKIFAIIGGILFVTATVLPAIIITSVGGVQDQARDTKRQADIRDVGISMEIYSIMNGAYPQAVPVFEGAVPNAIKTALEDSLIIFPTDPKSNGSCGGEYCWVDNTGDDQRYCVYAKLESKKQMYFASSEQGSKELSAEPASLPCW
ncbi:MAG: hypothetical protein Q8P70_01215 [bacterium]|nr:hypothetical protein [bacterium]